MNSRTPLLIFGAVVVGFIVWASFFYEQSKRAEQTPTYTSNELGVTFDYPASFDVSYYKEGNAERQWQVVTLLPKGYTPPKDSEGPPSIAITMFDNPEGTPLQQWIEGNSMSNFKLGTDQSLKPTTVGGEQGYRYLYGGLYETDAVAVAHGGKIYLLTAGWQTPQDPIRAQFQDLYTSLKFTK
ncbi:hypothetical protein KW798_00200 [Candidatus Parcubacteria bacterium]|nr:hypothetical protein [Candidatus Parcubacteria bacterium]